MSVETWKSVFDIGAVLALFLTFAFGVGVWYTGAKINERQAEKLRYFDRDLTEAKTALANAQREAEALRKNNLLLQKDIIQLREGLTWAHLSDEQQLIIASMVRPLSYKATVYVNVMGSGKSAAMLANELTEALRKGGVKAELTDLARSGTPPGLRAIPPFKITGPTAAISFMKELVSILERLGVFKDLPAPLITVSDDRGERTPDIDIQIGNKGSP
ncbi:MAG: hypothetical protein KIT83_04530 [Bryobacterales bacterium]|nr:hypothetical protein [Bryobacterales bacterium]